MEKIRNFRDLRIWSLGKEMVVDVYRAVKNFPKEEVYGTISQMSWNALIKSGRQSGYPQ